MTHLYMRHNSFTRVRDSWICVTWLVRMCESTHLQVRRIHMCDTNHSSVRHDYFKLCGMTHWYVWHDSCACVTCHTCECVMSHVNELDMSHICMSHVAHSCSCYVTQMNKSWHTCQRVMSHIWMSHDTHIIHPIVFGVSFLQSQISIDNLVLYVSFVTFRWKETTEIEIGDWEQTTLQSQLTVHAYPCALNPILQSYIWMSHNTRVIQPIAFGVISSFSNLNQ